MSSEANMVFKECYLCEKEVALSYECQKCNLRVCMICAIENKWEFRDAK